MVARERLRRGQTMGRHRRRDHKSTPVGTCRPQAQLPHMFRQSFQRQRLFRDPRL